MASFVLLSGQKEDLSINLKSMATHPGIPSSNGSIERRLPDSNSSLNGLHKCEYNAGHVQAELRNGSENFNSAVIVESSVAKCTNNVNQEDRLPASILNFTHDISCEAVVNTRATEVGTDVSSYNGVSNGHGYGNGNGIHHRGDTNPLRMEIEIDIEVERNLNDTVVNNCHEKNNLMSSNAYPLVVCVQSGTEDTKECSLSIDQRTIIELAEIGILHPFDCPPIEMEEVKIKMEIEVEVTECYSESTPLCGITEYCDEINKRDYELQGLSKHLEGNRIDDDICLSIRYMVRSVLQISVRFYYHIHCNLYTFMFCIVDKYDQCLYL